MRNKIILCVIAICMMLTGCSLKTGDSSDNKDYKDLYKTLKLDQQDYFVSMQATNEDGRSYTVVTEVLGSEGIAQISFFATGIDTQIQMELVTQNETTVCSTNINGDFDSYYCSGNALDNPNLALLTGPAMYSYIQNAINNGVYSEKIQSDNSGDTVRVIYKNDTESAYGESHYICKVDPNGELAVLSTPLYFDDKKFDITLDTKKRVDIGVNTTGSSYTTLEGLIQYANGVQSVGYSKAFDEIVETPEVYTEPVEFEEPEPTEPEQMITSAEIATLSENKDLFVKIDFSNTVEDIVFIAPTGGQYTVAAGNVEMMRDDSVTTEVFYRIPNAEMGVWTLQYDKALNDIEVETTTDNKIKISEAQLSSIKDGIVTASATLLMGKGTDLDYEYHVDVIDEFNTTVAHSTNILNTKKDKPNYTFSVMDLAPGTYKVRLRLEYVYDGIKFFNIFTTDDLIVE